MLTTAEERLKEIERLLPDTFYAGATLTKRIERMVDAWRRLVVLNQDAEKEREKEISRKELAKMFEAAEKYFLETGRSFWALNPVEQKNFLEVQ